MEKDQNEPDEEENEEGVVSGGGSERIPNGFVKGALHGMVTEEGDFDRGRSKKGTEDPGKLRPHKGVASDPGGHGHAGDAGVGRGRDEHAGEVDIGHHSGEGDEHGVGDQEIGMGGGSACGVGGGRVESHEKGDWGERAENHCGNGKAHELGEEGLLESESAAEEKAQDAIEESVGGERDENERRHFERDIRTHFRSPPESDSEAVAAEAEDDDQGGETNAGGGGIFQPLAEFVWGSPEEA